MKLNFSIARRYLFSKGNKNVINIISGIAASGVAVGSFAMIIVLSAFNGLETLVASLYTSVDPDIRISPAEGKTFGLDDIPFEEIAAWPEIHETSPTLEETVFLQYENQQTIVKMRGIDEQYLPNLQLDEFLIEGNLTMHQHGTDGSLIGYGIADNLNLFIGDGINSIKVYAAKRDAAKSMSPDKKFKMDRILASGIIGLNPEFDYTYFYVPLAFAEELLEYDRRVSFIDLTITNDLETEEVMERLKEALGPRFEVKSRIQLNEVIYKTNATEKWVTFFILSFILVVATFNLIGSLTMLIIEKKRDISLLRSIGQSSRDIREIFLFEGFLITGVGASIGLGLGIILVLVQQYIGFFPLEGGLVEYYPVELNLFDVLAVLAVVFTIGALASLIPVKVLLQNRRLQTVITS